MFSGLLLVCCELASDPVLIPWPSEKVVTLSGELANTEALMPII